MKNQIDLTIGSVPKHLFNLSFPMVFGILAILIFNVVDTFFVARLGTEELAAISFTFPVVILIGGIALGIGTAATSVISRAIGEGDFKKVKRFTTDSLILSLLIVAVFLFEGLLSIRPVFSLLGAHGRILELIEQYMTIWYIGMFFLVIPMVGNSAIRASGDTKTPSMIMIISGSINAILDPLLIFGLAGLPRLEMSGAALATVIARAVSLTVSLGILHFKKRMLDFSIPKLKNLLDSWKQILYIGIPAAFTNILLPLSMGVIMRIVSGFGPEAVAAVGAGLRIEGLALVVMMALSTAIIPFLGQNWGAKNFKRVWQGMHYASTFSLFWGIICVIILFKSSASIGAIFSKDTYVFNNIVLFLFIVPFGYGFRGICSLVSSVLNAINRPMHSALFNLIWMIVFIIPMAYLGSGILQLPGVFAGIALGHFFSAIVALIWMKRIFKIEKAKIEDN